MQYGVVPILVDASCEVLPRAAGKLCTRIQSQSLKVFLRNICHQFINKSRSQYHSCCRRPSWQTRGQCRLCIYIQPSSRSHSPLMHSGTSLGPLGHQQAPPGGNVSNKYQQANTKYSKQIKNRANTRYSKQMQIQNTANQVRHFSATCGKYLQQIWCIHFFKPTKRNDFRTSI